MKMKLPVDFPSYQIFCRAVHLPEAVDSPEDLQIDFHIQRFRIHVQDDGQSSVYRKRILNVDRRNGTVWLNRRLVDMDFYKNTSQGNKSRRIFANITITAQTRSKLSSKRVDIFLEFVGSVSSFCEPSLSACFPSSQSKYRISEGSVWGEEFDYLQNLGFPALCPNTKIEYNLTSDQNLIQINRTSGALILSQQPDTEDRPFISFKATCHIENSTFSMVGNANILDINDNAPTTQHGNTTSILKFGVKPGESFLNFAVTVVDKDSRDVNDLVVRIEDDSLNLFAVKDTKIYGNLGEGRNTFLSADIQSRSLLSFPDTEYEFTVIIEDASLLQKDRMVVYKICVTNETELELNLKEIYEFNISTNAAQYARIIQLSVAAPHYTFRFYVGVKQYDWIAITEGSGIVYVRDPHLMPKASTIRRNIIWTFRNETHNKTGSILLLLTIQEESPMICASESKWCSNNENRKGCVNSCAKGSLSGYCEWRTGPLSSTKPSSDYATCSPDLISCPDGQCDELEQMEPSLCPQDCARKFGGEVVVSKRGQGLTAAVGPCVCPSIDSCNCMRPYHSAEMRRHKSFKQTGSTLSSIIEISNDSLVDQGKLIIVTEEETTTPIEAAPFPGLLTDGTCGPGCIVFASIVPAGLLIVIVVLVVTRKIRKGRMSKHKFMSSHISLSGVPSDYVDDRSNSAQESRNTPSETSSFGKSSIDAKWEFPRNRLQIQSILGEGEFGKVMKAQAWNIGGVKGYTTVAVKMLKENGGLQEKQDLITEFLLLKEISHPNIVRLLGASTEKSGPFYLIVEFAELGSLRSYLRKRRRHNNCCKYNATYGVEMPEAVEACRGYYQFPCERSLYEPHHSYFHKEQLSFAWQITKGMAYLSDVKLVHRDLATRNVLLAKHKVVKISDFGLSRDIYEGDAYLKKSKGRVPVKWMAIESLEDQIYTSRSDVWSFGVVLWEIVMQGATPYPGVTPQRLYNLLKAGYRMTKPENCPDELYYLMRQCWRALPGERPSFKELVLKLDLMLQDTVEYMDFTLKGRLRKSGSRGIIPPSNGPVATIQYTSVLVGDDEEHSSDPESNENIGLARLFNQPQTGSRTLLTSADPKESTA